MRRRDWLLGGAGVVLGARGAMALPVPPSARLAFAIMRKGSQIGTHTLSFATVGNALTVTIAVRIAVYFGPLRVFHYALDGTESWANGGLVHIATITDNNGHADHMRADWHPQGLEVQGSGTQPYLAPPGARPSTHWNSAELNGPWINPEDGTLVHPHVATLGQDMVPTATTARPGQHYRLSGNVALDLWYEANQQWLSLGFTGKDGSLIRYVRQDG